MGAYLSQTRGRWARRTTIWTALIAIGDKYVAHQSFRETGNGFRFGPSSDFELPPLLVQDLRHPRKRRLGRAAARGVQKPFAAFRGVVHRRRHVRLLQRAAPRRFL